MAARKAAEAGTVTPKPLSSSARANRGPVPVGAVRWAWAGRTTLRYEPFATASKANPPGLLARLLQSFQKRLIAATVGGVRVVCAYVPNGQSVESDKYAYKLAWCKALTSALRDALALYPELVLAGDMNIAPEPRDVHDPAAWEGSVLFSEPERAVFRDWLGLGLVDSFRLFEQPPNTFSWWDYRMLAFPKNRGLRIDHILLSPTLAARCTGCTIDRAARKGERPSDHAPVVVHLA